MATEARNQELRLKSLLRQRGREIAELRALLVAAAPCTDCGAEKGEECRPEYGCTHASRRPRLSESWSYPLPKSDRS